MIDMETIFEHNVTTDELREITLIPKEEYLRIADDDSKARGLAMLFYLRGDKKKMKKYFKLIKSVDMRNSFIRTISPL